MTSTNTFVRPVPPSPKTRYTVETISDIPVNWETFNVRKKTKVTIRECNGVETFTVPWSESQLTSDPAVDIIVFSGGLEYPCKREIFEKTYVAHPEGGYIKTAQTQIVRIPVGVAVNIATLEGDEASVEAPDFIAIGAKGELYANTKQFVEENLEVVQ